MSLLKKLILICGLTFLVYLPSLGNQFVWDDEQFIYNNAYVKDFAVKEIFTQNTIAGAGENSNYYRPLTTLSFAVDHQIWGFKPFGFHLTNILLHIGAGFFICILLITLGITNYWALGITALFLLHPLQTEAVTYANSRGDSLYTFWGILGVLLYSASFLEIKKTAYLYNLQLSISRKMLLTCSCVSFLLSILSKEIGLAIFGLYCLTAIMHFSKNSGKIWKKYAGQILTLGILLSIAVGYLTLRMTVLNFEDSLNFHGVDSLYTTSVSVRLLTFSKVIWTYISLLLLPYPLHMERDTQLVTTFQSIWPTATVILILTLGFFAWKEWRQKQTIWIALGTSWFFGMLVPVSGVVPINGILYEHWLYVPLVGFFIVFFGFFHLLGKANSELLLYPFIGIIIIFSILTIRQNYIWGHPIRFYEYTLQHANTARLHNNLAMAYADDQQFEKAITEYETALSISDGYPQIYHNLANSYLASNDTQKAIENYQKALSLSPQFFPSYGPLITVYLEQKEYQQVLPLIDILIQEVPSDPQLHLIRGVTLINLGKATEADGAFAQAKHLSNNHPSILKAIQTATTSATLPAR